MACRSTFVWWNLFFAPLAAAVVSCRLYHTVPQALKLTISRQKRYNSSHIARLCGPLLSLGVCWHSICVCVLCALIRVFVCRVCWSVCLFAGTHTCSMFRFFWLLWFTAAAADHVVCNTPCLKLSSYLLCGSHDGTTAVAHQVSVDHDYAYVDISLRVCAECAMMLYVCMCVGAWRAGLCNCVLESPVSASFICSACCCCRIMSSVSQGPSTSQAGRFVADAVQQQSPGTFV